MAGSSFCRASEHAHRVRHASAPPEMEATCGTHARAPQRPRGSARWQQRTTGVSRYTSHSEHRAVARAAFRSKLWMHHSMHSNFGLVLTACLLRARRCRALAARTAAAQPAVVQAGRGSL